MRDTWEKFVIIFLVSFSISWGIADINGSYRNYFGVFLKEPLDYSIVQNSLNLKFKTSGNKYSINISPYLNQYDSKSLEIGVREGYVDLYFDAVDIRVGKQQIIWGKADGVFITDVVSPKDLTEFLLPDFEEIRTGVTAIKINYYVGDSTIEIVGVPVFTSTKPPNSSSPWHVTPDFPITPSYDYSQIIVRDQLSNGEIFAKFSGISPILDYEIMLGNMWDDDPTMHISKTVSGNQVTSLAVTPRHHRLQLLGGSFSKQVWNAVVRGEAAFYSGKYFRSEDPSLPDGVTKKNYVQYLLGIDGSFMDLTTSVQWISKIILDYEELMVNDEIDNMMTFLIRKDLLGDTLHLELFAYVGVNKADALIRPKVTYDFDDGLKLITGINWFAGESGMFGEYAHNDMIYTKAQVSF